MFEPAAPWVGGDPLAGVHVVAVPCVVVRVPVLGGRVQGGRGERSVKRLKGSKKKVQKREW